MARLKTLPDSAIFGHLLAALHESGDKAVTFGNLSQRSGLAPATLAQRFGSVEAMTRAALLAEWARLTDAVVVAEAEAFLSAKGAQALLKALPCPTPQILAVSLRDAALRQAAETWRAAVEASVATRRGGGTRGREAAALIFAAWQGRQMWEAAGGKAFRLSDILKALP
jgi:AcrR family transcriptional regulator